MSEPAPAPVQRPARDAVPSGVEVVLSLVLCVGLAMLAFVAGVMAMFFAMVSDGCHGGPDDPLICSAGGSLAFFVGLFALWTVLAVAVLGPLVMILRGRSRRRHVWHWPFVGLGVGVLGCLGFFVVVLLLAS